MPPASQRGQLNRSCLARFLQSVLLSGPACCIRLRPAHARLLQMEGVPNIVQVVRCSALKAPPSPSLLSMTPRYPPGEEHKAFRGWERATFPYERTSPNNTSPASRLPVHPELISSFVRMKSSWCVVQGSDRRRPRLRLIGLEWLARLVGLCHLTSWAESVQKKD